MREKKSLKSTVLPPRQKPLLTMSCIEFRKKNLRGISKAVARWQILFLLCVETTISRFDVAFLLMQVYQAQRFFSTLKKKHWICYIYFPLRGNTKSSTCLYQLWYRAQQLYISITSTMITSSTKNEIKLTYKAQRNIMWK